MFSDLFYVASPRQKCGSSVDVLKNGLGQQTTLKATFCQTLRHLYMFLFLVKKLSGDSGISHDARILLLWCFALLVTLRVAPEVLQ